MTELAIMHEVNQEAGAVTGEADETFIPLSDPDITMAEIEAVDAIMRSPRLSSGPVVEAFEAAFAAYVGRKYAIAVPSGTLGLLIALRSYGIGPGQEVVTSPYSFRETTHAICLAGARPVFADIDYWAGTIAPEKVETRITANTRAIVASNSNGHPAQWSGLRAVAKKHGLVLIEDSTEAIGSRYQGALVGTFGDVAVFDFAQPSALTCGEGGMVVTDDIDIAVALRRHRAHRLDERASVVVSATAPYQAGMSSIAAALGLAQLQRLD
jgi:perosamine synthetase